MYLHVSVWDMILFCMYTDKLLLGVNAPGSFDSFVEISPNSSITRLCFNHPDDEVMCEAPVVGNVRLLRSPQISLSEPSTAMVTIMDDDGKYSLRVRATKKEEWLEMFVSIHTSMCPYLNVLIPWRINTLINVLQCLDEMVYYSLGCSLSYSCYHRIAHA